MEAVLSQLGRLHIAILHLPIGLLVAVLVLEVLVRWKRREVFQPAVPVVLALAAVTAVLSALLGYLLTFDASYDPAAIFWHQYLGILLAGLTVLAYALYLVGERRHATAIRAAYAACLLAVAVLLPVTSHLGGSLTHGEGFLTQGYGEILGFAPASEPAGQTAARDDVDPQLEYATIIQPILAQRCVECHHAGKRKGNLQLDIPEGMVEPRGDDPPVIYPGDALGSELVYRLTLPPDDPDRMPPGSHVIPADEVLAIIHWINRGAAFGDAPASVPQMSATVDESQPMP